MPIEIRMPALSPTMESGTLAKWSVQEGDEITSGDIIAEIETDKATMEFETVDEGKMGKILITEGTEDVAVGELIALVLEEGEDASALEGYSAGAAPAQPAAAEPAETAPAAAASAPTAPAVASVDAADGARIFASPLARRIASQKGVDLSGVTGSGPYGRIIKRDVEGISASAAEAATATTVEKSVATAAPAASGDIAPPPADVPYTEVKLNNMRKTIARRLTESKQTVPHFYLNIDVELDNLLALRKELNSRTDEYKLSVNDFIIRASALALKKVPAANVQYAGDKIYQFERADISVAVAIDGGLITPVIKGADGKGLAEISAEMKELAMKARDGKLMPEEYQGGTFSLSNLGMFGIKHFDAVISPPQAAILAVGAGEQRAVIRDGAVAVATVMTCTLSLDHRALDGAVGAEYLGVLKQLLEEPLTMLL
ncbi:MAG: pyruvate dehydrogenase complex dihydrolipoamide acetyltransferase [Kordiimonas sp.]|nr:pyruvate dehydrogenase complex dihydrolipoamide acetyltransferase [Kordiimonas sp.]